MLANAKEACHKVYAVAQSCRDTLKSSKILNNYLGKK
jgi:hypothetical protein